MKTNIFTSVAIVLLIVTIAHSQDHPFLSKNVVRYPVMKAQNESTFSEMLPEKPLSKSNSALFLSRFKSTSTTQMNVLPEISPAKRNFSAKYLAVTRVDVNNLNSLPKKPASKLNF